MPAALLGPLIAGGAGALFGGLSGGGKQGKNEQTATSTSSGTTDQNQAYNGLRSALEPDYWTQFRKSMIPAYQKELGRVQEPVFGAAQKSGFMQSLNDLAESSIASMSRQMARRGLSGSGVEAQGIGNILAGRGSQAASFFSQLPMQEELMRRQSTAGLLGPGMFWAGGAPISEMTSGTTQTQGKTSQSGQQTGQQTEYGPDWWKGMLGNLGLMGSTYAGNYFGAKGKAQGSKPTTPWEYMG
jgi:hypothetical protein